MTDMTDQKKIILMEHRPDYTAIYGLNLNVYLNTEVLVFPTVAQVVSAIKAQEIELVFVDNSAYSLDAAKNLFDALIAANVEIPIMVMGKTETPTAAAVIFDDKIELKTILRSMAKELSVTAKGMSELDLPPYYSLPMEFIVPGWMCSADLYKEKGEEYEITFPSESVITQDELDELESLGNSQLFVQSKDRLKLINNLTLQIISKLNDPNMDQEEACQVTAKAYQMVREQARKIGVGETTMEIVKSSIGAMDQIISKEKKLSHLLKHLNKDEMSFRYRHSLLTMFISSHIIKRMRWGSKEQQEKVAYVAFFHDITLTKDEYARMRSDKEIMNSNLDSKTKKRILNHAVDAARLVTNTKVPLGVDTILKQHHGSKKGNTLSKLAMGISPLAIVFILAHEWAILALDAQENDREYDKTKVIGKLYNKYKNPAFSKVLPVLHELEI